MQEYAIALGVPSSRLVSAPVRGWRHTLYRRAIALEKLQLPNLAIANMQKGMDVDTILILRFRFHRDCLNYGSLQVILEIEFNTTVGVSCPHLSDSQLLTNFISSGEINLKQTI